MPGLRLQRIHCGRCSISLMSSATTQQRCGYWGNGSALRSKHSAFKDGAESSSISHTRRREMAFSVMPSAMMATPSPSTSAMGILPLSPQSSRTLTYCPQPSMSSGLLFVFQMFGHKFLWTTLSTPGSCLRCCTWQSVSHTELCKCPVVAFLHR